MTWVGTPWPGDAGPVAALAPAAGPLAVGLSQCKRQTASGSADRGADRTAGAGEPGLGLPADPGRAARPGHPGRRVTVRRVQRQLPHREVRRVLRRLRIPPAPFLGTHATRAARGTRSGLTSKRGASMAGKRPSRVGQDGYHPRSGPVRRQGLEPRTRGLRVRCSANLTVPDSAAKCYDVPGCTANRETAAAWCSLLPARTGTSEQTWSKHGRGRSWTGAGGSRVSGAVRRHRVSGRGRYGP